MIIQRMRAVLALTLLLMLVLPLRAQQDSSAGELVLFGKPLMVSAMIYQTAQSGTLTLNEDGTYRLALLGVADETTVVQVSPPSASTYSTRELAAQWSAAAQTLSPMAMTAQSAGYEAALAIVPSEAQAELALLDLTIYLTILSAEYDAASGAIVYTARLEQAIPFMDGYDFDIGQINYEDLSELNKLDSKVKIPAEFGSATLTISGTELFWQTLASAPAQRLGSIRTDDPNCLKAAADLNYHRGRLLSFEDNANALLLQMPGENDSPQEWEAWNLEMQAAKIRIAAAMRVIHQIEGWLSANCP